jgi:hypothetical protein
VIWTKTDAGRIEMTARTRVKERAQRNLLLLIDGAKSEEMLLANVTGVTIEDFRALEAMGLIAQVSGSGSSRLSTPPAAAPSAGSAAPVAAAGGVGTPVDPGELDYAKFTSTLTQMISSELGLRGFTLTLAVEKASTIEELRDVADRTIEQIRSRKGEPAAHKARRMLYGG